MSRESSDTVDSRLAGSFTNGIVVDNGMTMSIWIKKADWLAVNQYGMVLSNDNTVSTLNNRVRIRQKSSAPNRVDAGLWNNTPSAPVNLDIDAASAGDWDNLWTLFTYVIHSATSRRFFINGGELTNENTSTSHGTVLDVTEIDINDPTASFSLASGMPSGTLYAEACVWDAALTDVEVGQLWASAETGPKPHTIRQNDVYGYWSLEDGDSKALTNQGKDSGGDLTANNMASNSDHPILALTPNVGPRW